MARVKNYALSSLTASGNATTQVGQSFPITHMGARGLRVDIVANVSAYTSGNIVFKLQQSADNINWSDVKSSANITSTGDKLVSLLMLDTVAADQTYMPLAQMGRIVAVTAHADNALSVSGIFVQQ